MHTTLAVVKLKRVLNFIVTGQNTIDLSESNQSVHGCLNSSSHYEDYTSVIDQFDLLKFSLTQ